MWLTLGSARCHYETYFMPAPEENVADALRVPAARATMRLFGTALRHRPEDAVYLVGQMPLTAVDEDELDRLVGSAYAYVEQYFRPAMRHRIRLAVPMRLSDISLLLHRAAVDGYGRPGPRSANGIIRSGKCG